MAELQLDGENALFYLYSPPTGDGAGTFVFVNALTGSTNHWETVVAPALRGRGFGTLSYDLRGQDKSRFAPQIDLTNSLIVDDPAL